MLFLGGLFSQFRQTGGKSIVDQGGRFMPVVQIAINIVNNKSDGLYDNLLPNTQVCCGLFILMQYLSRNCDYAMIVIACL